VSNLDLNKLEEKLDNALNNETSESLNEWLKEKRMTNNKQQTAVDIIYQGMSDKIVMQDLNKALICIHISHDDFLKLHRQAKEMEKERIIDAHYEGQCDKTEGYPLEIAEQYYNETYADDKQ